MNEVEGVQPGHIYQPGNKKEVRLVYRILSGPYCGRHQKSFSLTKWGPTGAWEAARHAKAYMLHTGRLPPSFASPYSRSRLTNASANGLSRSVQSEAQDELGNHASIQIVDVRAAPSVVQIPPNPLPVGDIGACGEKEVHRGWDGCQQQKCLSASETTTTAQTLMLGSADSSIFPTYRNVASEGHLGSRESITTSPYFSEAKRSIDAKGWLGINKDRVDSPQTALELANLNLSRSGAVNAHMQQRNSTENLKQVDPSMILLLQQIAQIDNASAFAIASLLDARTTKEVGDGNSADSILQSQGMGTGATTDICNIRRILREGNSHEEQILEAYENVGTVQSSVDDCPLRVPVESALTAQLLNMPLKSLVSSPAVDGTSSAQTSADMTALYLPSLRPSSSPLCSPECVSSDASGVCTSELRSLVDFSAAVEPAVDCSIAYGNRASHEIGAVESTVKDNDAKGCGTVVPKMGDLLCAGDESAVNRAREVLRAISTAANRKKRPTLLQQQGKNQRALCDALVSLANILASMGEGRKRAGEQLLVGASDCGPCLSQYFSCSDGSSQYLDKALSMNILTSDAGPTIPDSTNIRKRREKYEASACRSFVLDSILNNQDPDDALEALRLSSPMVSNNTDDALRNADAASAASSLQKSQFLLSVAGASDIVSTDQVNGDVCPASDRTYDPLNSGPTDKSTSRPYYVCPPVPSVNPRIVRQRVDIHGTIGGKCVVAALPRLFDDTLDCHVPSFKRISSEISCGDGKRVKNIDNSQPGSPGLDAVDDAGSQGTEAATTTGSDRWRSNSSSGFPSFMTEYELQA